MANIYNGSGSIRIQPGGLTNNCDADGKVWTAQVRCSTAAWGSGPDRGDEGTDIGLTEIPAGYYLDTYTSTTMVGEDGAVPGMMEATLIFRDAQNMGDGIVAGSPIDVYGVSWIVDPVALAAFTITAGAGGRYSQFATIVTSTPTTKTLWGYALDWLNAGTVEDQGTAYNAVVAAGNAAQIKEFKDFVYWHTQGVESVEIFLPVLTRTTITNTAPTTSPSPGQIEPPPSAFGALEPAGFSWRRMPDEVTRQGRNGAYSTLSMWKGNRKWATQFYGTFGQQSDNWMSPS